MLGPHLLPLLTAEGVAGEVPGGGGSGSGSLRLSASLPKGRLEQNRPPGLVCKTRDLPCCFATFDRDREAKLGGPLPPSPGGSSKASPAWPRRRLFRDGSRLPWLEPRDWFPGLEQRSHRERKPLLRPIRASQYNLEGRFALRPILPTALLPKQCAKIKTSIAYFPIQRRFLYKYIHSINENILIYTPRALQEHPYLTLADLQEQSFLDAGKISLFLFG